MADAGLNVVSLHIGPKSAAQLLGGQCLPDGADVVALSFHREQRGASDRAGIDATAMPFKLAEWQCVLLKHGSHSLQIEFSGQIHNGAIFIIERSDRSRLRLLAISEMAEEVDLGFNMALKIHAHKSSKLHKSRVDTPQGAGIAQRYDTDQLALEPPDRSARRQPIDLGRVDPGIDRAGHQCHTARLRRIGILRHYCYGCEHRDARLAHSNNMGTWPEYLEKSDDVIDKVVELERTVLQPDVSGIVPVSDVDVVIGEEHLRSAAQQGGEMPRHRRYQENARLRPRRLLLEAQQRTKRRLVNSRLAYSSLAAADRDGVDAESRPMMTEARARDKLAEGGSGAQESMARHPWRRLGECRGSQFGDRPNRSCDVGKSLEIMVNHGRDNKRVKERVDG